MTDPRYSWCQQCGRSDMTVAVAVREVLDALGYDSHRIDYTGDGAWEVRVNGKHLCFVRGGGEE